MKSVNYIYIYICLNLSLHQMTPLHVVAESGRSPMVKPLVNLGADVNIKDNKKVIKF